MELREALKAVGAPRTVFAQSDVCLVEDTSIVIPETPEEKRKYHENGRPCVILSGRYVCDTPMFPIVSIAPTSHLVHLKDWTDFEIAPNAGNGLREPSLIMLAHIQPVRKSDVFKNIGRLSQDEWDHMCAHLLDNYDLR